MRFASDEQRKAVMARLHSGSSSKRRPGASLKRKSKRRSGASLRKKPVIKSPGEQYLGKQIDVIDKTAKLEGKLTEYGKKVSYGGMVWSRDDLRRCFSNLAKKKEQKSPRALPQYTINGKQYFRDDRLQEYRAVDNPHDVIKQKDLIQSIKKKHEAYKQKKEKVNAEKPLIGYQHESKSYLKKTIEDFPNLRVVKVKKPSWWKSVTDGKWKTLYAVEKRENKKSKKRDILPKLTKKEPWEGRRKHKLMTKELRRKIPKLYSQEDVEDPMIHAKFFSPYSDYTLYISEFDGEDIMFGYVTGMPFPEWGYSSLNELAEADRNGLPLVERDRYFTPKRASKIPGIDISIYKKEISK